MLLKKHDTKNYYPFFWAFVAMAVIVVPYYGVKLAKEPSTKDIIIWVIAGITGLLVVFKSRIDLFHYKNIYNSFVRLNIEILINSSVRICSDKHIDKEEEFFGEFLERNKSKKQLISMIRSKNFDERINDEKKKENNFNVNLRLPFQKGFAGVAFRRAVVELRNILSNEDWKSELLKTDKTKFPIILDSDMRNREFLSYSEEEMKILCEDLGIKSVIACPVVIFKKRWYSKKEKNKIIGVILYTSNLELPRNDQEYDEKKHSSLPSYRSKVIRQARYIAKLPKIYEGLNKDQIMGELND